MWRPPRELIWTIIGAQTIAIISLWPTYYPYGTALPGEATQHPEMSFLGIRLGEWLLGLATVMLWAATARLVEESKTASERQLRAYVLIEKAQVVSAHMDGRVKLSDADASHGGEPMAIQSGYQPRATFAFKNFGQTPAHDVEMFGNVAIVPWPIREVDLPPLDLGIGSREIIGPGRDT